MSARVGELEDIVIKYICDRCGNEIGVGYEAGSHVADIGVFGITPAFERLHLCFTCRPLFAKLLNNQITDFLLKGRADAD